MNDIHKEMRPWRRHLKECRESELEAETVIND